MSRRVVVDMNLSAKRDLQRILASTPARGTMSKVEDIERRIQQLSSEELTEFRHWFAEFDARLWDQQFEADVQAGKLDAMAERALRAHAAGQSSKL